MGKGPPPPPGLETASPEDLARMQQQAQEQAARIRQQEQDRAVQDKAARSQHYQDILKSLLAKSDSERLAYVCDYVARSQANYWDNP